MVEEIEKLITKYMRMLGCPHDAPRPQVFLRSNIGSKWLGRSRMSVPHDRRRPPEYKIEVQRTVVADPKTLERVVAHEVVHHANYLELNEVDFAQLFIGIRPPEHGEDFDRLAAKVNAVMGDRFVTVTSDEEYVHAPNQKEYVLYVAPAMFGPGKLGYAWAVRVTEKAREKWMRMKEKDNGKFFRTTDERWIRCKAKISEDYKGLCFPTDEEAREKLKAIYESGPSVW